MSPDAISFDWPKLLALAAGVAVMLFLLQRTAGRFHPQDRLLLGQLRARGMNLAVPQPVGFLLYTETQENADRLAAHFAAEGFTTDVATGQIQVAKGRKRRTGPPKDGWILTCTRPMVLSVERLNEMRDRFAAEAAKGGALYLGWQVKTD